MPQPTLLVRRTKPNILQPRVPQPTLLVRRTKPYSPASCVLAYTVGAAYQAKYAPQPHMPGLTCWCECKSVLTLCEAPGPILPFGNEIGETMLKLEAKWIHWGLGAKAKGSIVRSTWR